MPEGRARTATKDSSDGSQDPRQPQINLFFLKGGGGNFKKTNYKDYGVEIASCAQIHALPVRLGT